VSVDGDSRTFRVKMSKSCKKVAARAAAARGVELLGACCEPWLFREHSS
jgi:hypothetical protein